MTRGSIRDKWAAFGWEGGLLGYPQTNESNTFDGVGKFNHFQGGSIYWHPSSGAHVVYGAIREKWVALGREAGALGFPTSDEQDLQGATGRVSLFQRGRIEWLRSTAATTAFDAVGNPIADASILTLKSLICHDTQDATGDDEAKLVVYVDGVRTRVWRKDMNDDDSNDRDKSELVLNVAFRFRHDIRIELWDEDTGFFDSDDHLGSVIMGPQAATNVRVGFVESDASYTLLYDVAGPAQAVQSPQQRAQQLLASFRTGSGAGVFTDATLASRATVAASIAQRLINPDGVDQDGASLCGPAAVMHELVTRRPDKYVAWTVEIWQTGAMTVRGRKETISDGLRRSATIGSMTPADWILMASLRDIANVFLDVEAGESLEGASGMTAPWAIKTWTETLLDAWGTNIETSVVYGEYGDLDLASRYVANGGVAFLLVNADILEHNSGWGQVPDHWMVLHGGVHIDRDRGRVEFTAWTWGQPLKNYSLSEDRFEDAFYGVVVGMTGD